jgi:hypothetical protein
MRVTLRLDDFGKRALEAETRGGSSRDAVVRAAARHYLDDEDSGRIAWRPPRFVGAARPEVEATDVCLDPETIQALEDEAHRQGIAPERLAEHAFLYFLADLDSGRIERAR